MNARIYLKNSPLLLVPLVVLSLLVSGCGIQVKENDAQAVMEAIFKARKSGNVARELPYYSKEDFKIVPFEEIKSSLYNLVNRAGRLKSIKALKPKTQTRNQLGKGMVKYLIMSYEVTYSRMVVTESYYFLGSSEKPKLVYLTLQR